MLRPGKTIIQVPTRQELNAFRQYLGRCSASITRSVSCCTTSGCSIPVLILFSAAELIVGAMLTAGAHVAALMFGRQGAPCIDE
ncbi:hypothetical protein [Bradyrhizobium cenepequi]|uniref:hypothetical protein n=1 Tax=Bradyrhizobium cenepequi TaxID=2821403 RepID=UPI001CE29E46|nr:hypothetical protein [Bradyrhizobium cenepequi]MCA6109321.1 hypothetical protein [Bradyrhizobium cenepequi]